jgi:hypothetical protein
MNFHKMMLLGNKREEEGHIHFGENFEIQD